MTMVARDRREVLRTLACVAVCPLLACKDAVAPTAPAPEFADDAATVRGNTVEIELARVPQWRAPATVESAVVFLAAQVIVVRRSPEQYRAFSAVCPHAGCGVSNVRAGELVCPCHNSTFAFDGARLSGPAPSGLVPLVTTYDASAGHLTIQRVPP